MSGSERFGHVCGVGASNPAEWRLRTRGQDVGSTWAPGGARICMLCITVGLAIAVLMAPTSALASRAHGFLASFGVSGEAAGQLSLVSGGDKTAGSGVAVNAESHDIYVADTANNRVDQFKSNGDFVRAWGWGVSTGAPELQSCTVTCRKGLSGTSPGELEAPTFVAVDNALTSASHGDVYVSGAGENGESPKNLVTKFSGEGALVEGWGDKGQLGGSGVAKGAFGQLAGLAVDSSGSLWVYAFGTLEAPFARLFQFGQAGIFEEGCRTPEEGGYAPQGLAVDSAGNLYFTINAGSAVKVTCANGLGIVAQTHTTGIAIDSAAGDFYVDTGSEILDIPPTCKPSKKGCSPVNAFGPSVLSGAVGLAVDPGSGVVYAANAGAEQVAAFNIVLESTILVPEEVTASSATLRGKVNPEGAELTRCKFEYGETNVSEPEVFDKSVPCEESFSTIGNGNSPVEVSAQITDLTGGKAYDYRLRASNAVGDVRSEQEAFTTLPTAVIEEAFASEVEPTSARLSAKINPKGLAATYRFEYDTSPYTEGEAPHGTNTPIPDAAIGSGSSGVVVSQQLAGLTPNTTYYFRVIATDVNGAVTSPEHSFIYLGLPSLGDCGNEPVREESQHDPRNGLPLSTELPDCRAYELVSPSQKNAALLAPAIFGLSPRVSDAGDRVIASSIQCFAASSSCTGDRFSKGPPFEFERTNGGWTTTPLAPPAGTFENNSVWGYSADNGLVLYSSPTASHVTDDFYARETDGSFQRIGPISEDQPYQAIESAAQPLAMRDLSHVVYESSNSSLWPSFDVSQGNSLYEYAGFGSGEPLLVGVKGKGAGEEAGSTDLISVCGTNLGRGGPVASEALSADGRTVYFTVTPCANGSGLNKNTSAPVVAPYARVDGELPDAHTVALAQPQCGNGAQPDEKACREAEAHPASASLEGISEDGSKALFSSAQQLTDTASEHRVNLYLYDFVQPAGQRLLDISAGDSSGLGPQVQGLMALSADGSHVYFVARGVLSGKNGAGKEAAEGEDNLYVYAAGHTTFIATLPGVDKNLLTGERAETEEWTERGGPAANVTPDGRTLVFTSHGALTPDATNPNGPAQVYRYDAQSEELERVSIGERGFNDNGNQPAGEARLAALVGLGKNVGSIRRDPTMSDDGSIVFFQSPAALTPGALDNVSVNGRSESPSLAQNVYEWEQEGKGGCEQQSGCVHLISDGRDVAEAAGNTATYSSVELLGSDTAGENVFLTTVDPLVKQDSDTQLDIYDARVGGGFPAPAATHFCAEGQAGNQCRSEPGSPPAFAPLGSATFAGAGNLVAPLVKPPVKAPAKPLTRAQLLAKALKLCHAKHKKPKRRACERQARKKYGPKHKAKRKSHGGAKGKRK
jgi:hypothetical protein